MRARTYLLWKKLLLRVSVCVLVFGILYVYFMTGALTIREYRIVGAPAGYEERLREQFGYIAEQKILWFLPGNRVVSFQMDEMKTTIMEVLPNTKKIRIYPSGLHVLTVKLEHHEPLFAVSDTYAISKEGIVYKEIVPLDTYAMLSISTSTEVTSSMLRSVALFTENISTVLYPVRYISIDEYNDIRFYDERVKTHILIRAEGDIKKQWSNILSAIDTDPLKSKLSDMEKLEYLDTRFGNKVFYKFTNDLPPAIIAPTNASTTATTTLQ